MIAWASMLEEKFRHPNDVAFNLLASNTPNFLLDIESRQCFDLCANLPFAAFVSAY